MKNVTKKRLLLMCLTVIMVFAFSACTGGGNDSASSTGDTNSTSDSDNNSDADTDAPTTAEPITLTIVNNAPVGSTQAELFEIFAAAIEEESGGSLKAELYQAGSLVTLDQAYEAVTSGRVSIADFALSYYSPYIDELRLLGIPGLYKGLQTDKIVAALEGPIDEIIQTKGIKFIAAYGSNSNNWIVGTSLVKDPSKDFKGKTVRVSGEQNAWAVESWGGATANIPIGDLPTALERKTVDQAMTAWTMIDGQQLYNSAKSVTSTLMSEPLSGLVINLELYNSLTDDQKAALDKAGDAFYEAGVKYVDEGLPALKTKMEEAGADFYENTEFDFFHEKAMELVEKNFDTKNESIAKLLAAIETLQ